MDDFATAYRATGISREAWVKARMHAELQMAVFHCIETGNAMGAYVYTRLLARSYNPRFYIEWMAFNV